MAITSRSAVRYSGGFMLSAVLFAVTIFGEQAQGDLFEVDDLLRIRLEGPLTTLAEQTQDGLVWVDGSLTVFEDDGTETMYDIRLKGRSYTRRNPKVCDFPPYWIDFKKKQIKDTRFAGNERLKVVSHCRDSSSSFDQYIHREYLAYRTYNLLTDQGFRVRRLTIQYVDTDGPRKTRTRAAFFIEHLDSVAERLGGMKYQEDSVYPNQFDPIALKRAEVFQFMIGNTDYSFEVGIDGCCHNSKVVFYDPASTGFVPLPYDFDMTGVVNPPYAVPHAKFGIKKVTQRAFRGTMAPPEVWEQTLDLFHDRKDAILTLWSDFDQLSWYPRREARKFIEGFYEIIEDEEETKAWLLDKARDPENISATITRIRTTAEADSADDTVTASPQ